MANWPKNDRALSFEQITGPLVKAVRFAYKLKRQNRDIDIPWKGPDIGGALVGYSSSSKERLSAEHLIYAEDNQNRDALEEIIALAVQLGIEQGRRIEVTAASQKHEVEQILMSYKARLYDQLVEKK